MKKVLADLNKTITALENLGLVRESEQLNNVFIKVAQGLFPGLGPAVQQAGPFVDLQKFTLPKQKQLGNMPVGSNAWNKSLQIALGISPNLADGIWGPKSQQLLDNLKAKNPNYDSYLASIVKPVQVQKTTMPTPTGTTGP